MKHFIPKGQFSIYNVEGPIARHDARWTGKKVNVGKSPNKSKLTPRLKTVSYLNIMGSS